MPQKRKGEDICARALLSVLPPLQKCPFSLPQNDCSSTSLSLPCTNASFLFRLDREYRTKCAEIARGRSEADQKLLALQQAASLHRAATEVAVQNVKLGLENWLEKKKAWEALAKGRCERARIWAAECQREAREVCRGDFTRSNDRFRGKLEALSQRVDWWDP